MLLLKLNALLFPSFAKQSHFLHLLLKLSTFLGITLKYDFFVDAVMEQDQ